MHDYFKTILKSNKYIYKFFGLNIITVVSQAKVPLKVHFTVTRKCRIADTIHKRSIIWILPLNLLKSLYTAEVVKRPLYMWKWGPKLPGMIHYQLFLFIFFFFLFLSLFALSPCKEVFKVWMGIVFFSPLTLSCGTEISGHIHFRKLRAFALGPVQSLFLCWCWHIVATTETDSVLLTIM